MRCAIGMARPRPPVSPCVPWPCSGTATPTAFALAATTRLAALRSTTSTASSTIPTGSTTYSSPPPWEVTNYEPRNPLESDFFQNKPISRLIAPGIQASHLNDDTLGRALDILYAFGVTALYGLIAATAAARLGLRPTFSHLDTTSFHVDGRYNSDKAPDEQVVHLTHGYSRDHRPDLNQVMLELVVEHQAGLPVLMQPLSGKSHDGKAFGQVVSDHIAQLSTTCPSASLVADSALYSADNLHKLAETSLKWITRVPATLTED